MALPRGQMFYVGLYREDLKKIFLSETTRPSALLFWYAESPSGTLPSLFRIIDLGQKWPRPGGQLFYIGLYREKV